MQASDNNFNLDNQSPMVVGVSESSFTRLVLFIP